MKLFLIPFFVLVQNITVFASADIDSEVQSFLSNPTILSEEKFPVLIQFSDNSKDQGLVISGKNPGKTERVMREHTRAIAKKVLQSMNIGTYSVITELWISNSVLTDLTKTGINSLLSNPLIKSIRFSKRKSFLAQDNTLDFRFSLFRESYTYGLQKLRIPEVQMSYPNVTGAGITVGILDTGMDPRHPDLANKIKLFKDFTREKNPNPRDDHGHGTHVAGTIAGGNTSGMAIGVAPRVNLIIGKAYDSRGGADDDDLLLAMQWMADPDNDPATQDAPKIVSNSWNVDGAFSKINPTDEPFCKAIDTWQSLGIIAVFAAGNDGSDSETIKLPAACPNAVSVAATDEDDQVAGFSSRGPVSWKSQKFMKPDVAAPGVYIYSADPFDGYRTRSGTSMAAPHVAGVLALMLEVNSKLTAQDAKAQLMKSSDDLMGDRSQNVLGAGRVNSLKAIQLVLPEVN